jgi:crossover junction endodeoxyribonuclease RusA
MIIEFYVPGIPKALQRHRHTRTGLTYDPSRNDKQDFILQCRRYKPRIPLYGPLELTLKFILPRPKHHFRTGKFSDQLKPKSPTRVTGRPDLSNLIKFVEDSFNGEFYRDDAEICVLSASKVYCEPSKYPRTEVILTTLNKD